MGKDQEQRAQATVKRPEVNRVGLVRKALFRAGGLALIALCVAGSPTAPDLALAAHTTTKAGVTLQGPLFGVSPDGNGAGVPALAGMARTLRHKVQIVNLFEGWTDAFPADAVAQIRALGAIPEITWQALAGSGADQPAYSDARVASGAYDSYITTFAKAMAASGPVLLRYQHEMNANWYPWAAGVNGNTAADVVAAYRHVHDVVTAAGARRVLWVWSPNAYARTPVDHVFPGPSYVDVIGLDNYNDPNRNGHWLKPASLFDAAIDRTTALAPKARVLINETGSTERGGSKATWLRQLFAYAANDPRILGVVYSEFSRTWSLASSRGATAAARAALGGKAWRAGRVVGAGAAQ